MSRPRDQVIGPPRVVLLSGSAPGGPGPEVEFRHLRYFVGVAEELHFGRAASRLYITQPGLSQSIAKLERALSVQLLQRSRRGVQLTDAGREFLGYARRLLAEMDDAVEHVRSVGRGRAGVLRIGVAPLAEQLIAPALTAFQAQHPGIVLDRTVAVSERLLAQLSDGGLHIAIVHQVPALASLARMEWEVVRRGRMAVVMSRRHPLASRALLALTELSAETFLVNPRELAPSALAGLKLMCAEYGGFDPRVLESGAASAPALDADWRLIRQEAAIGLMAEEAARAISPDDVAVIPLRPPPRSVLAIARRQGDHFASLDRFVGFVRSYRDTNAWSADNARLSQEAQTSIGRLLSGPVSLTRAGQTYLNKRLRTGEAVSHKDLNPSNPRRPKRVAIVISNPTVSTTTGWPVGFWWAELTHPYFHFTEAGYEVEVFSPEGGRCEADAMSDPEDASQWQAEDVISRGYKHDPGFVALVAGTRPVDELAVDDFDALLVAGGQGPMFTFEKAENLQRAFAGFYEAGKVAAAMCHGTAILRYSRLSAGEPLVAGKTVTGLANVEEDFADQSVWDSGALAPGTHVTPWRIEDELRKLGANYVQAGLWKGFAVRDGNLVTGQQNFSGGETAQLIIETLGR